MKSCLYIIGLLTPFRITDIVTTNNNTTNVKGGRISQWNIFLCIRTYLWQNLKWMNPQS